MQNVHKADEIKNSTPQGRSLAIVLNPAVWIVLYITIFGVLGLPRLRHPLQEVRETDECTFGTAGFDFIQYGWPSNKIPSYNNKFWKSGSITTELLISLPMRLGVLHHEGLAGLLHPDPALRWRLYPWARSVSLLFAIVSLLFSYLIGVELFNNRHVALFAPLFLFLNPDLLLFSKLVRGDVPGLASSLVSAWFCLRYLKKGKTTDILLASFFAGVAISFKFNYLFTCLLPVVAWITCVLKRPEGISMKSLTRTGLLMPMAAVLGLVLSNPFIIFDPSGYVYFLKWVLSLTSQDKITASLPVWQLLCGWHFWGFVRFAYGLPLAILFLAGIASFVLFYRRPAYSFVLVSMLAYYFAMVFSGNQQQAGEHRQFVVSIALAVYLILLPVDLLISRVSRGSNKDRAPTGVLLLAIFVCIAIGQFSWKFADRNWWDPFYLKGASRATALACFRLIQPGSSLIRTNALIAISPFYEHYETRHTKMMFNTYAIGSNFLLEPSQARNADYLFILEGNYPTWEEDFNLVWRFVDYKGRDSLLLKNKHTKGTRPKTVNPFTQAELWRAFPPLFENGDFEHPGMYPSRQFGMLSYSENIWGSGMGKYVGRVEANPGCKIEASLSQVLPFSRKHLAQVIHFDCLLPPEHLLKLREAAIYLDLHAYTFSQMLLGKRRYLLFKAKDYPASSSVQDFGFSIANIWHHVRIDARKEFMRDWDQVDFLKVSLTIDSQVGEPVIFFVDNFRSEYETPSISSSYADNILAQQDEELTTGPLRFGKGWWDEIHTVFDKETRSEMMEDLNRAWKGRDYKATLALARNVAFLFPDDAWIQRHAAWCMLTLFHDAKASYKLISLSCALLPDYRPFQDVLNEARKKLHRLESRD